MEDSDQGMDKQPFWFCKIKAAIPDAKIFTNVKLGDGFAHYAVIADEQGVMLVWSLEDGGDAENAAQNLESAKADLHESDPGTFQEMILLLDGRLPESTKERLSSRGVLCLDESQFVSFAIDYLSVAGRNVRIGKAAFLEKDYDEAFRCLDGVVTGDRDAQYMLGFMYAYGRGVEKDEVEAVKWYRMAAEQGHDEAQDSLGDCYYFGDGVAEDDVEAVKWYRMAAEQDNELAQCSLGDCYYYGDGVAQDYTAAAKWFSLAAGRGDAEAQCKLGEMYVGGLGVQKDEREGMKLLRMSAEQGFAKAQVEMGIQLGYNRVIDELVDGRKRDWGEQVEWFRKAAEQGNAEGEYWLGMSYEDGEGVRQDYREAMKLYLRSSEHGNPDAEYQLGAMYENGKGVSRDEDEAIRWYCKAAEQGNEEAVQALRRLGMM